MAKMSNRFREDKEKRLEEEVRGMTFEQREEYLERIADYYLGDNSENLDYEKTREILEEKGDSEISV